MFLRGIEGEEAGELKEWDCVVGRLPRASKREIWSVAVSTICG